MQPNEGYREAERRIEEARRTHAKHLNLSRLSLTVLPEALDQFTQLQELYVQDNQLTTVPEALGQLPQLQILNVAGNQLTALPEGLGQLTQLQKLNVSGNQLTELPESLSQLTMLRELNARDNQLAILPVTLGLCPQLQSLDVTSNQLVTLPEHLSLLSGLQSLSTSRNLLTELPETLGRLTHLRILYVGQNKLVTLPGTLGQLTQLQELYISDNNLESLPETLRELKSLKYLWLHNNPNLDLPEELLGPNPLRGYRTAQEKATDPRKILDYYFRTRGGRRPLNEAKLILVGRGEVGKTCLVNRLVYNTFKDTSKTDGIAISAWRVKARKDEIRLNMWDFGGQEIMHATHQFFLTERSLYLLVLNGREGGEDADAEYWLKLIESFGRDSPVIIVQNKIKQHPFELNYRGLMGKYPQIRGFVRTDCEAAIGIDQLHQKIIEALGEMENVRASFPAAWFAIKDALAGMQENYLSFEQFRALCKEHAETDMKAQDDLAYFLHCLGIALNYKDDPRLRDTSVLNPRWVTEGIYKILNAEALAERKGVLRLADLKTILPAKDYPEEKHEFLMELMRKFRLCFAYPEDHQNHRYLIPELLGKEEPELKGEFDPKECLNFEYHYTILPEGLLPQFIVRTHQMSHGQPRWRSGVVLEWEGCRALVKAEFGERRIVVRVRGENAEGRRRLLAVIHSDFERIHGSIHRLEVKAKVPLPYYPNASIDYEDLLGFERDGIRELPVRASGKTLTVYVSELLNGVDIRGIHRQPSQVGQIEPSSLFYSYSHKDEVLRDELETHLKLLQRERVITTWHDRRIMGGEEWAKEIDKNLEGANIILLLVSADFIASDYCYEIEMKRALERHEKGEAVVIPVILRDCHWQKAPFGIIQALPKDGRAVKLWSDRDSAWKDVELGIRKVAETFRTKKGFKSLMENQIEDAPFCDVCGHMTIRNGTCFKCPNCGNSMGCS